MNDFQTVFQQIDGTKLFWAIVSAILLVGLVAAARAFGKLKPSRIGLDLNLLTYGFLCETAVKAIQDLEYWPRFHREQWPVAKGAVLFLIALVNVVFSAWNMKLDESIDSQVVKGFTFSRALSIGLGTVSLLMFLVIGSILE